MKYLVLLGAIYVVASIHAPNHPWKCSPPSMLLLAAASGETEKVHSCLKVVDDVNSIKDQLGCTAFHLAAMANDVQALTSLLAAGAAPRLVCAKTQASALTMAQRRQSKAALQYLMGDLQLSPDEHQVTVDFLNREPADWLRALRQGAVIDAEAAFLNNVDVNVRDTVGCPGIVLATINERIEAVQYLFERGADPLASCDSGLTALQVAAERGFVDILKLYHRYEVDLETELGHQQYTALTWAARAGQIQAATYLHKLEGELDEDWSGSPLMWAAAVGNTEMLETVLKLGMSASRGRVTDIDHHGHTVLHWAARDGNLNNFKKLHEAGADIDARSHGGLTPLMTAAFHGNAEIIEYIKTHRGGIEIADKSGWTAVFWAVVGGKTQALQALRKAKAVFNIQRHGWNPMHIAAATGNFEMMTLLMQYGLNFESKTGFGKSSEDIAIENGHEKLVSHLQRLKETLNRHRRSNRHEEL